MGKHILKTATFLFFMSLALFSFGQARIETGQLKPGASQIKPKSDPVVTADCDLILDTEPNFAKKILVPTDSLLLHDIQILKHCGNFDEIDSELLKGSVLTSLLNNEIKEGKPATYRTILEFISNFRKTQEYQEFKTGVLLYKNLENKKVNLNDWDRDQQLFIRMGFTQSDLDDFKEYISTADHKEMTYKQAYLEYIKEIDALPQKQ